MAHTFGCLLLHVVFSTKARYPWLHTGIRPSVHAYIGGIVRNAGARPICIGGIADHVHILLNLPPRLIPADMIRLIKTNSSFWLHQEFPELRTFAWQTGYGLFSVSYSNANQVESYIAHQEEHHRALDFKSEFEALLKRHELRWDDPYLWE